MSNIIGEKKKPVRSESSVVKKHFNVLKKIIFVSVFLIVIFS